MAASTAAASKSGLYADPREDWLALRKEEVIDPQCPIVDPHHHLWDRGGQRYLIEELAADIGSGHNIVATVYVEARSMYRAGGPEALRPVGEVEFANGAAAMSASGGYGPAAICAGIVGHVNLLLGDGARAVLEAEIAAGQGRFRGIRHSSAWDADADVAGMYATRPRGLLLDTTFRKGFACLAPLGLSFDSWLFHPQVAELTDLARAFPDTKIVLDHCGGPIGVGGYANRREEIFVAWKGSIREIAKCPNVVVKLGGLAMRLLGYDFHERPMPPSSEDAAAAWRP
jgi:predicted TIM-barrel fold metal-dependent hydrolase